MTGAIGQNHHVGRHEQYQKLAENEALPQQVGAGVVGTPNSFSYYQPAAQTTAGDSRITPLAQPQPGSANVLGSMDTNDLLAQLNGLRLESEERTLEAQEQSTLANRESRQAQREKRIKDLENQLSRSDHSKKDKCATAKIVLGALLGPAGVGLMLSGIQDKKAIKATENAHNKMLQFHFGAGYQDVASFEKEYAKDHVKDKLLGQPLDQPKHQAKLNELKDKGVIDADLHADLSKMVAEGASPDAIHDRILNDAITAYVDQVPPDQHNAIFGKGDIPKVNGKKMIDDDIQSVKRDLAEAQATQDSGMDYKDILALMAQLEQQEEMEKVLREVQENLQGVPGEVATAAQSQQAQLGQMQNHI